MKYCQLEYTFALIRVKHVICPVTRIVSRSGRYMLTAEKSQAAVLCARLLLMCFSQNRNNISYHFPYPVLKTLTVSTNVLLLSTANTTSTPSLVTILVLPTVFKL